MRIPFFSRKQPEQAEDNKSIPRGGEISFRDPMLYPKASMWTAYNPDIFVQRKGGLEVYDKMRRDEQIKACQWIKRLSVLCSGWDVEPIGDDPADLEAADFVKDVFVHIGGTFEEKIKEILSAMDYGYSVTEKVWGYMDSGWFRGKIGLANLKTRKPHRFDFDTDEYGNLRSKGLWQMNGQYKYDPRKFVIYSHGKEFDNWYGTSDLQSVYRPWWSKDVIIKFWNIFLEKYGMGIPYLRPAEGKTSIDPNVYRELKNVIFNLQNGSAIAQQTGDALIEILESKRRGQGEYDNAIQYYDRAIGHGLMMPSGLGFQDEKATGSLARSRVHFNVWMWIMMDMRKTTEEMIQEQVIKELVDYNFTVNDYPKFKFRPLEDEETGDLAKLWLEALEGKAVHPDAEDELHFRTLIKFPEKDRDELQEEFDQEKEAKKNTPPPFFRPGNPPNQAQEDKIELHVSRWFRDLTKYERRCDFARIEQDLDGVEGDARARLTEILKKQMHKTLNTVEKAGDKIDQKWVQSFGLQYGLEFQTEVKEFIRAAYEVGRIDASQEVARARGRSLSRYVVKIPPEKMIQFLEKNSFWIKGVLFDGLTKQIQALLLNALETGEAPGETLLKIRAAYEPYVGDPQKVLDQRQIEPYRIETVIRTNTTKAYARGRMAEYADPDLDGFVRAVQLSAILDTRTTDICTAADGKIILLDDPMSDRLLPPLHFNCRTIPVPVTEADGQFEATKQADLHRVAEKMPADFGGNVDK